ncbi:MAG: LysR family transcriptional regulator [Rhodospirillales bacterium]|nr:LysR family transcriptional regulator [Rhodospirillales bacterium]
MDINQAKTFLAVVETGSFVMAGEQLNVTQSTVSARIKNLEYLIGRPLFTRGRSGAVTTGAGEQFKRHAAALIRVWDHARQEAGLPENFQTLLNAGGQFSFWDNLMLDWARRMRANHPAVALRMEGGSSEFLTAQMNDGLLDLAVMYSPQNRTGLIIEKLFDETLVALSSHPDNAVIGGDDYIYIEWGDHFRVSHAEVFPDVETPGLSDGIGTLALEFILRDGGTGYFPQRMSESYIREGRLFFVPDAPKFQRPVFLVFSEDPIDDALPGALDEMRRVVSELHT